MSDRADVNRLSRRTEEIILVARRRRRPVAEAGCSARRASERATIKRHRWQTSDWLWVVGGRRSVQVMDRAASELILQAAVRL
jgi:hypothetical protein